MIPKPGGGERPLGIPTIRDRVVQTAAKLVLEPIFEADFEDGAYGYRPSRSAIDAIKEVHRAAVPGLHRCGGRRSVASISTRSRTRELLQIGGPADRRPACAASDQAVAQVPVEERDGDGKRRMSGGKSSTCGTPQGGVISPLLANLYMNRFLKHWRQTGTRRGIPARIIVNYADDFVILSRGHAEEALAWTRSGDDAARVDTERGENLA